jgi:hypothetical protein
MTSDYLALIVPCRTGNSSYLNVDDFRDPEESEQIHVTVLTVNESSTPLFCFTLSTVSATLLVNELIAAVARRKGGEPWTP